MHAWRTTGECVAGRQPSISHLFWGPASHLPLIFEANLLRTTVFLGPTAHFLSHPSRLAAGLDALYYNCGTLKH